MPQSKPTELCSSVAVVPQSIKVESTEMWSSAAPFQHDLWYFRHRTSGHFSSMLFIRKKRDQPTVAPLKSLKSIHPTKLLETLLTWAAHTFHWHSTEGFDDSLESLEIERCSVSEPVFKHNYCAPAFTTKMWSWVDLWYHHRLRRLARNGFIL